MPEAPEYLMRAILIGMGATAFMDVWAAVRHRLFGIAPPDYGLVGRWLAYFPSGRFHHTSIAASPAMPRERLIGWTAHYLIGIAYAALLLAIWGLEWSHRPTIAPAMIVGIATVAAPLLLMQPGMGAGIAGRRTPRPGATRLRSVIMHGFFGVGLYAAGLATVLLDL